MGRVDHQPHMIRPEYDEWCGGTQPPTLVSKIPEDPELSVDVFKEGLDLHDGHIYRPTRRERYFSKVESLDLDTVTKFALKAVGIN